MPMLVKATGLEVDFRLQEARQGTGKDPLVYLNRFKLHHNLFLFRLPRRRRIRYFSADT